MVSQTDALEITGVPRLVVGLVFRCGKKFFYVNFRTPLMNFVNQGEEVLALRGTPKTLDGLAQLFLEYLRFKIPTTPFSPEPLSSPFFLTLKN